MFCRLCGSAGVVALGQLDPRALEREYLRQCAVRVRLDDGTIGFLECRDCGLRFFAPAEPGSEEFYAALQRIPWYYQDEKHEFALAARRIQPDHDVLEIGAGRGAFARRVRARSYHGLEFSPAAIAAARAAGVQLRRETVEEYAAAHPASRNVVCAFQVLEHVRDPRSFLEAAVRCLRPGGSLIVSVPAEDSFMGVNCFDVLNMPPHHLTRWTDRALGAAGVLLGLRLRAIEHEPLAREHRRLHARVMAQRSLARLRGWQAGLLDARLAGPLAELWVRPVAGLLALGSRLRARHPAGHTVIAVFERP